MVRNCVCAAFAASLAWGSCGLCAQEFDAGRPLYTIQAKGYALTQLPTVLDQAYGSGRPVLFYVHGWGDEPRKSFDANLLGGGALPRLEREYGVRVVMFNWNSKSLGADRADPIAHIPDSLADFKNLLSGLATYRRGNPENRSPALLVHSMGSILLADSIQSSGWAYSAEAPLFSAVLVSAPDVDSQDHAAWLEILAARERVYVTQNRQDTVLRRSTHARILKTNFALGLEAVPPLAPSAFYIDLSDALGSKNLVFISLHAHQIFSKGWMGGNVGTCAFVSKVLRGERFDLDALEGVTRTGGNRYAMKRQVDRKNACFKDADESAQLD